MVVNHFSYIDGSYYYHVPVFCNEIKVCMIHYFMNLVFDIFIHNKINSAGMEKEGLRMDEWKFQGSLSRMNIIKSEGTY